jgi:hypothetical protein
MTDSLDWIRTLGINGGVFAAVSLADMEVGLRIIMLAATIVWTVVKIIKLIKDGDDKTK